jgi:Mg2+ and Co2+ transporter CorA
MATATADGETERDERTTTTSSAGMSAPTLSELATASEPAASEPATAEPEAASDALSVTVRLFDADRTDSILELDAALARELTERHLLWIDVSGSLDTATANAIAGKMELKDRTRRLLVEDASGPYISLHGSYVHIRVETEADRSEDAPAPGWLDLIASKQIVLSRHRAPIELLEGIDERIEHDTGVGSLDGPAFVHAVLGGVVTGYFRAVDAIEDAVDDLDGRALRASGGNDLLSDLVGLRRRIARLRRAMSDQREVFATLGAADFEAVIGSADGADFASLADRFESALRSVEDSRDLLLGSFDVFMTRTAQGTNDVMKVLALATVLLLPGSLVASLLGMNVNVPLPGDSPVSFWLVVGAIMLLAAGVLAVARARRWI